MRIELEKNEEKNNEKNDHVLTQGNAVSDEIKVQVKKMKDKPFKEKIAYFFEYYKWPVIITIGVLFMVISVSKAIVNSKDYCFNSMIVNSANIDGAALSQGFGEYAGMDLEEYECLIDSNLVTGNTGTGIDTSVSTKFAANVTTNELDCVIFDSEEFSEKALTGTFADLREVLSPEDISIYEPYFYYIDKKAMDEADADDSVNLDSIYSDPTPEEIAANLASHMDPASMSNPIPVGIVSADANMLKTLDAYYGSTPVYGILINSQRKDKAVEFLHYIYDQNIDFSSMALN